MSSTSSDRKRSPSRRPKPGKRTPSVIRSACRLSVGRRSSSPGAEFTPTWPVANNVSFSAGGRWARLSVGGRCRFALMSPMRRALRQAWCVVTAVAGGVSTAWRPFRFRGAAA